MSKFDQHLWILSSLIFVIIVTSVLGQSVVKSADLVTEPIVTIQQGKLRGKVAESRTGRHYVEFLGIPYTRKPERFQLPGPPPTWEGTRDATRFRSKCLQYDRKMRGVVGSEDCLYVNVYTPVYSNPKQTRLPVMVFIHGGSFTSFSGDAYSPKYLMDDDVIVITFNYRLGALGFLTTLDKLLPANLGMKDQVACLTWVKKNVASFGGDDNRITVMGSSAGAASVSYHLISPMSRGLFHRAISLSGTALCPWTLNKSPLDVTRLLVESLSINCSLANSYTMAACLRHADAREIIEKQNQMMGWKTEASSMVPFAPVIESAHSLAEGIPVFLPDSPTKLFREGRYQRIPWITGVNSLDGVTYSAAALLNSTKMLDYVDANWAEVSPLAFMYKDTAPNLRVVSQKIRDFYFGTHGKINSEKGKVSLANALSDRNFFRCTKNAALLYAKHSLVWIYYFTFSKNNASILNNYGISNNLGLKGVVHSEQLQYIFFTNLFPEIKANTPFFYFSQSLIRLFVSFAAEGQPTKLWGRARKWDPLPPTQIRPETFIKMYNIDENTAIMPSDEPFHRLSFWDRLRLQAPQATVSSSASNHDHSGVAADDGHSIGSSLQVEIYVKILILLPLALFFA